MGARYRYAADRDDQLLAIEDLSREARRTRAPYRCIGCERELIPKMGSVVAHHFAHKFEHACAGETYLHRLAKLAFIENYRRCLSENRPVILAWTRTRRCNHFQGELGFSCSMPQVQRIDLTRAFDLVELERERDGFRADVLLHSSKTQKRLFVEFVVTHQSSPEKRSSGIPIIEVEIHDEDHAVAFAHDELDASSPRVKLYNFTKPEPGDVCGGNCLTPVDVFLVHPGGKCVIAEVAAGKATSSSYYPRALRKRILGRTSGVSTVDGAKRFRQMVREAHFEGVAIRNCFVCRRHGIGIFEEPIFCKALKQGCESNEAATCPQFSPFSSPEEGAAAETRNLLYVENREKQRLEQWKARTGRFRKRPSLASTQDQQARDFIRWEHEWKRTHPLPGSAPDS
jgi:hypothetical protein